MPLAHRGLANVTTTQTMATALRNISNNIDAVLSPRSKAAASSTQSAARISVGHISLRPNPCNAQSGNHMPIAWHMDEFNEEVSERFSYYSSCSSRISTGHVSLSPNPCHAQSGNIMSIAWNMDEFNEDISERFSYY